MAPFSTAEQKHLAAYSGRRFSRQEAKSVWERVLDHKWHLSERLGRDVGFRVAASDFVENFYPPGTSESNPNKRPRIPFKVFSQYDFFAAINED